MKKLFKKQNGITLITLLIAGVIVIVIISMLVFSTDDKNSENSEFIETMAIITSIEYIRPTYSFSDTDEIYIQYTYKYTVDDKEYTNNFKEETSIYKYKENSEIKIKYEKNDPNNVTVVDNKSTIFNVIIFVLIALIIGIIGRVISNKIDRSIM